MESNLEAADFAVMVCTKRYVDKANAGVGGVGYEKMIMTSASLTKISDSRVIPIVRERGEECVPTFLKTRKYIDLSCDEDIEYSLDELLRFLLNAPLYQKPDIGTNPFSPLVNSRPDRTADGLKEVMTELVNIFNSSKVENVRYDSALQLTIMPRLKFDKYFTEAMVRGLVERYNSNIHVRLTTKGLAYAEQHGLIEL